VEYEETRRWRKGGRENAQRIKARTKEERRTRRKLEYEERKRRRTRRKAKMKWTKRNRMRFAMRRCRTGKKIYSEGNLENH
jgi:hypothetical protein